MKVVYLAHPLGAGLDRERNRRNASRWVAWAASTFHVAVIADWIILSGEWPETPGNRELGLAFDLALVARADEVWLVGGRVSPGMALEAAKGRELGKRVVDMTDLGYEAPPVNFSQLEHRVVRAYCSPRELEWLDIEAPQLQRRVREAETAGDQDEARRLVLELLKGKRNLIETVQKRMDGDA